ncbi:uncharacterized protein LOC141608497 [Silene latifolia]|uniref:uncharacterized protein LOC141608497 n=1 Tax=Silene latifolia TaxID=37657 RepID=UPI003D76CCA1
MPSSECLGSLPRLLTEPAFEACQNGESLNEASQCERGTLRRCLFEENQKNYADSSDFRNFSDSLTRIEELTNLPSTGTPGNMEMTKRPNTATGSCALLPTGINHVPISKPLGIGLHLNSVVYSRSLDSSSGSQLSSLAGLDIKNSVVTGNQLDRETNATVVGKVSTISEQKHHNKASSIATSGEAKHSNIEHFYSPVLSKQDARTTITCPKRKINPSTAESDELHCKMSPKKKRKKSSDDDTSKHCNCKKTKCLKL